MANRGHAGGPEYWELLVDIVRRARDLEARARNQRTILDIADPSYGRWISIERRYATVRGNAEHLLQIRRRRRRRLLSRFLRRWSLF